MRKLNAHGNFRSDWDPDTYLLYIVREDHGLIQTIPPFPEQARREVEDEELEGKRIITAPLTTEPSTASPQGSSRIRDMLDQGIEKQPRPTQRSTRRTIEEPFNMEDASLIPAKDVIVKICSKRGCEQVCERQTGYKSCCTFHLGKQRAAQHRLRHKKKRKISS
jgi:hypothetical protein